MAAATSTATTKPSPKTTRWLSKRIGIVMAMNMSMSMNMATIMGMFTNTRMTTTMGTNMRMITVMIMTTTMRIATNTGTSMRTIMTTPTAMTTPTLTAATTMRTITSMTPATSLAPPANVAATSTELVALLHLASPALPIGAFSYSQGLEAAIEAGIAGNAADAGAWIEAGLDIVARGEGVLLAQQFRNWQVHDAAALAEANAWLLAMRESAELRQETEQMGWSLAKLVIDLEWGTPDGRILLQGIRPISLPTAFAYAAQSAGIGLADCLTAWLFAWTENQVSAALKAVPLGQVAGQRILFGLRTAIAQAARQAAGTPPDAASTFSPMLGILSSRHETQYSRLFRS